MALFHKHDWEIIGSHTFKYQDYNPVYDCFSDRIRCVVVQRCKKCGKIRKRTFQIL